MRDGHVVWLPASLHDGFTMEADQWYPLETGGALMGYWHNAHTVVVTAAIAAGPHAVRERHNFEPDQVWQVAEIARHYNLSARRETYVGDWHSHPNAMTGHLSFTDRRVLRRIINAPAARAPNPIMMVLHGASGAWQATTWQANLSPRQVLWPKLVLSHATLQLY